MANQAINDWLKTGINISVYACKATLSEEIGRNSMYGRWLRQQEEQGSLATTDEDFVDTPFDFVMITGVPTRTVAQRLNKLHASDYPISVVAGQMSVLDLIVPEDSIHSFSDLQLDRWFELNMMLRILVPRLHTPPRVSPENRDRLRAQLAKHEGDERTAVQELGPASKRSLAAKAELNEARAKVRAKKAALDEIKRARAERITLARQAVKHAQSEKEKLGQEYQKALRLVGTASLTRADDPDLFEQRQQEAEQARTACEGADRPIAEAQEELRRSGFWKLSEELTANLDVTRAKEKEGEAKELLGKLSRNERVAVQRLEFAYLQREKILADFKFGASDEEDALS